MGVRSFSPLALLVLAACANPLAGIGEEPPLTPPGQPIAAVRAPVPSVIPSPPPRVAEGITAASLWQSGPSSLFGDRRARDVGDILTVIISIDDSAEIDNRSTRSRSADESVGINSLFGLEQQVENFLPSQADLGAAVGVGSDSSSQGQGSIRRGEAIDLLVAATVTDILPNGNFVIVGSQEVRVNYELRDLQIAGIIRPEDISRNNTISYEKIAEARISYGGRGDVYRVQQPRYGYQALDRALPF